MKKRITSGILAVLLVFGTMTPTMAVTSFAAESDTETQAITNQDDEISVDTPSTLGTPVGIPSTLSTVQESNGFKYTDVTINGVTGTKITKYTGSAASVVIPNTLGGKKVISIGENAFNGYNKLTSVIIPSSITTICARAFAGCTNLKTISLPSNLTSMGSSVFRGCTSLEGIALPGSNVNFNRDTFSDCPYLTVYVTKGSKTETACKKAGLDVSYGTPKTGTIVSDGTWKAKIRQGEKVAWVTEYLGDTSARYFSVTLPATIKGYTVAGINSDIFSNWIHKITSLDMHLTKIKTVPAGLCKGFDELTSVRFSNSTTIIGNEAFRNCTSLKAVALPSSVTSIGEFAFCATKLSSISLPNIVSLGSYAFGSTNITTVTLPASFKNVTDSMSTIYTADSPFHGSALTTAVFKGDTIPANMFNGCTKLKSVNGGSTVKHIGAYAFWNANITSLVLTNPDVTVDDDITHGVFTHPESCTAIVTKGSKTESRLKQLGLKIAYDNSGADEDKQYYDLSNKATASIPNKTYTGQSITPTNMKVYDGSGKLLTYGVDYTVSLTNNINVGTVKVTITGKGQYHGSFKSAFEITPKALTLKVSGDGKTRYYNGTAQKPVLTVKDANNSSRKLVQGQDYSVSFSTKCINAGTVKATVTLKGNYTGTATYSFKINPKNIGKVSVTGINSKGYSYTGYAIKPNITLSYKVGSKKITLKKGTDYTVSYKGNTNNGTATMTITGKGNYSGSVKKTYKINKRSMSKCTFDTSKVIYTKQSSVYNNAIVVYTNSSKKKKLKLGTDYTLKWDCKGTPAVGKHTVTITAKNSNLKGSHKLTVVVRPQKLGSNITLKSNGSKALKATWKSPSAGGCSGFCLMLVMHTPNGWHSVETSDIPYKSGTSTYSYSWSKLHKGTYKLHIAPYTIVDTMVGKIKYFSVPSITSEVTIK